MNHRIKLLDYQLHTIKYRLAYSYDKVTDAILDKYKAYALEDLNATDYDDILEDIQEWTAEITADTI